MKALAWLLLAAAACWMVSEVLELVAGGRTPLSLWLTAIFHLFMAAGIWSAYSGQGAAKGRLSLVGAGMASIGFLVLVYPPIAASQGPPELFAELMTPPSTYGMAGIVVTLGLTLFGVAVLLRKSYRRWIGVVLATTPLVFAAILLGGGPSRLANAVSLIQGAAIAAMAIRALRRQNPAQPLD